MAVLPGNVAAKIMSSSEKENNKIPTISELLVADPNAKIPDNWSADKADGSQDGKGGGSYAASSTGVPDGSCRSLVCAEDASTVAPSDCGMSINSESSFYCRQCMEQRPIMIMKIRSGSKVCNDCVGAYGSIQHWWQTNKDLRAWFRNMSPADRASWYKKQRTSYQPGKKRELSKLEVTENTSEKAARTDGELYKLIPWRIYRRHALMDGESVETAAHKFISTVHNNRVLCRFHRGEWHVPEYQGIEIWHGSKVESGVDVVRKLAVENKEDLGNALTAGQGRVAAQLEANRLHASQGREAVRGDAPHIDPTHASQPAIVQPQDVIAAELGQQAMLIII